MRKRNFIYKLSLMILPVILMMACSSDKNIEEVVKEDIKPIETIQVWCSPETQEVISNSAKLFNEKSPRVIIKITAVPYEELHEKLKNMDLNQAEVPDIIETSTYKIPHLVNSYPRLFKELNGDIENLKNNILPWKLEEVTIDERLYAFPWDIDPRVMIYNKDLAEKYGIDPFEIKTWDEFLKLGETVKEKSLGKIKLLAVNEGSNGILYKSMLRQLGKSLYKDADSLRLPIDENKRVLSLIKGMYDKQVIYEVKSYEKEIDILSNPSALCTIADGRVINRIDSSETLNNIKWQVEALPAFEYGGKNTACGEGNAFMVTKKNSENVSAMAFVKFMVSDSESNIFALKRLGYIPASTEFYSLPIYNGITDNYNELRVWRFMAEGSKGEITIKYDEKYEDISKRLLQLEKDTAAGKDIEMSIMLVEEELNKKN